MGVVTLAEFRADLLFDLSNRGDLTTAQQDRWINSAYSWMSQPRVHRHKELCLRYDGITLATGTQDYSLSTATVGRRVNAIRGVFHYLAAAITPTATRRKVHPRSLQWMYQTTTPSGAPTVYALDGDTLMVHGVPTATENGQRLRVLYRGEPTPLAAGGDTTVLGPYFDRVLRKAALAFALEDLRYRDLALEARQEAVMLINEVPDDEETDEDTGQQVQIENRPVM